MRKLILEGDRLSELHKYLSEEHGELDQDKINNVDVFISEKSSRLVVNVGCMILYHQLSPKMCEIRIKCAGGGHGKLNIDYGAVEAAEKKVYKSILNYAHELGLR